MPNPPKAKPCPVCGKPSTEMHAPFCSRGCKDRDLLTWLGYGYRRPGPPADLSSLPGGGVDSEDSEG
jgi:endogenous inhibitor of DNA gyrase (YacG/DUF329 family)